MQKNLENNLIGRWLMRFFSIRSSRGGSIATRPDWLPKFLNSGSVLLFWRQAETISIILPIELEKQQSYAHCYQDTAANTEVHSTGYHLITLFTSGFDNAAT